MYKRNSMRWAGKVFSRSGMVVAVMVVMMALSAAAWRADAQTPDVPNGPGAVQVDATDFAPSGDPDRPAFVPGELLVGVSSAGQGLAAQTLAAQNMQTAGYAVTEAIAADDGESLTQVVSVPAGEELLAAEQIAAQPGVTFVEPNYYVYAAQDEVGDSAATSAEASAAYLLNDTYYAQMQWNMQRIDAARAWQLALDSGEFAPPSTEIIVAVIDSGIDADHPEFAGHVLPGKNYVDSVQDEGGQWVPAPMKDNYGHGTHVSGIIVAAFNNGKGVAGLAPMVMIDPRRVLGQTGGGTILNVATAIREAADDGARILNMSLVVASYSQTLADAVTYAADAGALVVAASGNASASSVYYPAAFPEAIAVGALNYFDIVTGYSNHGPELDIAAPGGDAAHPVFSTWPSPDSFPVNGLGEPQTRCANLLQDGTGHYCTNYGTSFAAPEVAGVAALLLALNPELTADDLRAILLETATPVPGFDATYVGQGKLNAYNAVRMLLPSSFAISPAGYFDDVPASQDPYTLTVRVENEGMDAIAWTADLSLNTQAITAENSPFALTSASSWITLTSGVSNTQSGSARWDNPGFLTLALNPAKLASGVNLSQLSISANPHDNGANSLISNISLLQGILSTKRWLPVVMREAAGGGTIPMQVGINEDAALPTSDYVDEVAEEGGVEDAATGVYVGYHWEQPAPATTPSLLDFTAATSVGVTAPFPVTVGGVSYTTLRVWEDGVVTTGSAFPSDLGGPNRCMPMMNWRDGAIFGWWANLDAHAAGARISTFTTTTNRFVIQFDNVPAEGTPSPYKVSFQIALDGSGNVRLNYKSVPLQAGRPDEVTVGVLARDGLIYSQVACTTPTQSFGTLPASLESLLLRSADLY